MLSSLSSWPLAAAAAAATNTINPQHYYINVKRQQQQPIISSTKPNCYSIYYTNNNNNKGCCFASSSSSSSFDETSSTKTKLFVSGLSFRTSEESLRNAFKDFGQLLEVNLVMDKIANRPRGFAFLRYATEDESQQAIDGMHGKFLDGRVIFVEVAKPRTEHRQEDRPKQTRRHY